MSSKPLTLLMVILATGLRCESKTQFCRNWFYRTYGCSHLNVGPNDTLYFGADVSLVENLKFFNCRIPKITSTFFSQFTNLVKLELQNSNINEIEEGAFNKIIKLQNINLSGNLIKTPITNRTFSSLTNLFVIQLNNNKIENVDQAAFDQAKPLQALNLNENSISGAFMVKNLKNLVRLDLSHNHLTRVVLKGLIKLETLRLYNNNITMYNSNSLNDLVSLKYFYSAYNDLELLAEDLFGTTIMLSEIDLSHNRIQSFSERVFSHLSKLIVLYLNHNQISYVKENSFRNCTSLKLLRFWQNNITYIEEGAFNGLPNLEKLELENNQLSVISDKLFSDVPKLKYLKLNDNSLIRLNVRKLILSAKKLEEISIADNSWNCQDLLTLTEDLRYARIAFDDGNTQSNESNVEGIACSNAITNHDLRNANESQSQELENYLKNDFPTSNFFKYFNDDYKNSSLYRFFKDNYLNSELANYLQDDFKESKFIKFFNEDFVDSNFFKYMKEGFKDKLRKRLEAYEFTSDTMNSANSEAEALNMDNNLQNSINNVEIFGVILASVGAVLFVVILVFMVVLYRTIRELHF